MTEHGRTEQADLEAHLELVEAEVLQAAAKLKQCEQEVRFAWQHLKDLRGQARQLKNVLEKTQSKQRSSCINCGVDDE